MPENDRLTGSLDEINVDFVERETTPRLLMNLSIQLHLAGLSLSNTVSFFMYLVLKGFDPLFITGFTSLIYSRGLNGPRITLRSIKR